MANIFKTTLKKDVIADIASNNTNEIRFPITKFWATRLTDEYNLDEKVFEFRSFDCLEVSSPSNKDTDAETFVLDYVRTFMDGDEFVVEFKMNGGESVDICPNDDEQDIVTVEDETVIPEEVLEEDEALCDDEVELTDNAEIEKNEVKNVPVTESKDVFAAINEWFEDEKVLDTLYNDESVIATNARQVIVLPKGKVLGVNKTLPVNNDVEVRVEFDMSKKIYFDSTLDFDVFEEEVFRTLAEIRLNNFVFIWKRYTGIFQDVDGKVYFGIRYSTRKSIGFNRKYNVQ